jgi:phage terminase large subunit-like protein
VCAFIEAFCRVPDGPEVGQMVKLRDWQRAVIKTLYDPVDKTGARLIKEAIFTCGRKSGKTSLASCLVLAHLIGPEAQHNSRIYSAAYDREQASIVYNSVGNMVMMDRLLNNQIKLLDSMREAKWYKMGVVYKALSAEARTKHGLNPSFVILDELAQFGNNRLLYDVLKTSFGVQKEPLMLILSTQAEDDVALLSQLIDYGRECNSGIIDDPTFKLIEYTVPDGLDIYDEKNWILANPALGDFRSLQEMRSFAARAKLLPSVARKFENLYLNRRVSMAVTVISKEAWAACDRPMPPEEELVKCRCIIGLDLSSKIDLTALVLCFELPDGSWAIKPHFFTPKDTIDDRTQLERVPYREWVDVGLIEAIPGTSIDYTVVAQRLLDYFKKYDVICVAYDKWRMDILKKAMIDLDFDPDQAKEGFLEFGQTFKEMTPALETLEQWVTEKKIIHGGHPVMRFNVASAVAAIDGNLNRKLDKRNSRAKIDGMVAMVMGLHASKRLDEIGGGGPSVYDSRGLVRIGGKGH